MAGMQAAQAPGMVFSGASASWLQAGGEPAGMAGAEAARRAALAAGDGASASAAEAALLAALLGAQFGAARVDPELGFVLVDVRLPSHSTCMQV